MSFYTTLNFALWPDLSTPETIGTHSAIGIGVAGWLATFSSTALALYFQAVDLTLLSHLNVVQALSLLLLFGLAVGLYVRRMVALARENGGCERVNPTEALPLLIVVLLMISIGGGDIEEMSVTFQGDNTVDSLADVHVVAGGATTVPGDATVDGDVYVIGGTTVVDGRVDGDVTVLDGNLTVHDGATVTGTIRTYSGATTVSPDASVGHVSQFEAPTPSSSPAQQVGAFLLQFLVLDAFGWWLVERHPLVLENVGAAITDHALISGVVGSLGATTLLVLFVYMAFTLILLPVAVIGLFVEFLVILYGQVAFGYLVGTRLPVERDGVATVAGIAAFLLVLEFLGTVPSLGGIVQLAVAAVGFGAVLNTYFGLQRFEPVTIPGGT